MVPKTVKEFMYLLSLYPRMKIKQKKIIDHLYNDKDLSSDEYQTIRDAFEQYKKNDLKPVLQIAES